MNGETESQFYLRRAKEHLAYCQQKEAEARTALVAAEFSRRKAKEKYEALFIAEEQAEYQRRKSADQNATW